MNHETRIAALFIVATSALLTFVVAVSVISGGVFAGACGG